MHAPSLLNEQQIEDILNVIEYNPGISVELQQHVTNSRENLRDQLKDVRLYPQLLDKFKEEVRKHYYSSCIQPGEMVGIIAASSIGEQNTQASLNSFHQSGAFKANLTGGLARMNELMNATSNTKTPSLTIYFNKSVEQTLENIRKIAFTKLMWVELDDVVKSHSIDHQPNIQADAWYSSFNLFVSREHLQYKHRLRLNLDVEKMWRHQLSMKHIIAQINKQVDVAGSIAFAYSHESMGIMDLWVNDNVTGFTQVLNLKDSSRIAASVPNDKKMYFFISKVVLPNILGVQLSGVEGIKECYYTEIKREWRIDTKGGVLKKLLLVEAVDPYRSRSNDMHEILQIYGIEATKQFLRDEFSALIKPDKVNPRHLELLIDCMTYTGGIQRVTRNGIDRKQVGTKAKASFEQPVDNFLISASMGEQDPLQGVSASITVGKRSHIGTGFMQLLYDQNKEELLRASMQPDISAEEAELDDMDLEIEHLDINGGESALDSIPIFANTGKDDEGNDVMDIIEYESI